MYFQKMHLHIIIIASHSVIVLYSFCCYKSILNSKTIVSHPVIVLNCCHCYKINHKILKTCDIRVMFLASVNWKSKEVYVVNAKKLHTSHNLKMYSKKVQHVLGISSHNEKQKHITKTILTLLSQLFIVKSVYVYKLL